jgi:hypothetical protein
MLTPLRRLAIVITIAISLAPSASLAQGFAGVLTYHNDNARTGQNLFETALTPATVNSSAFGKLYTWPVDGYVYAQPLYIPSAIVKGHKVNVVIIATEHDSVYAFNADSKKPHPLWKTSFLSRRHHVTSVPWQGVGSTDLIPEIGITSTPVIDPATGTIYVVAETLEPGAKFVLRLHALGIANGKERKGSPVELTATVPGDGAGNDGDGHVDYDPGTTNQRAALTLANGVIYIANASHGDIGPYHGWVLGYDETTLQQAAVYNATPNGSDGGIWMSGSGPCVDAIGNLYLSTGNGTFDIDTGGTDYGDSFLKLGRSNGALGVLDFFTPWDQEYLDENDLDLGSGGLLLPPDQQGGIIHVAISAGKDGNIYVVNRDAMGGYNAAAGNNSQIVQEIDGQTGGFWSTPAYWNGSVYFGGAHDPITQYQIGGGMLSPTPTFTSTAGAFGWPGTVPSISANGASSGILWAIRSDNFGNTAGHAVLYAFDASDIATELYDSNQAGTRDLPGAAVKFSVPTVANGKVYIGGQYSVTAFGLLK